MIRNIGPHHSPATDEIPKDRNCGLTWKKTAKGLLNEDGPLAVATTSKDEDAQMEIEALLSDNGDLFNDNLAVGDERTKPDRPRAVRKNKT